MNANHLKAIGLLADVVVTEGRYLLIDGKGRVVMFDLTQKRAEEFLRYYPGGRVERMDDRRN